MDSSGPPRAGRNRANQRWFIVWLVLGAALAGVLLFNSIETYRFVSRRIVIDQVRAQLKARARIIERELQKKHPESYEQASALIQKSEEAREKLVWHELRAPDGHIVSHSGLAIESPFPMPEIHKRLRNHDEIFTTIWTPSGEVAVEMFAMHFRPARPPEMPGIPLEPPDPAHASTAGANSTHPPGDDGPPLGPIPPPKSILPSAMLEIAMSMADVNAVFWPVRRSLIIDCSAAFALLATSLVAALRFRSYVRTQDLEQQLQLARQVQQTLLPRASQISERAEVAAECVPASHVGGDFYDTFLVNQDDLAVVLGDVAGKGVPAALLASLVHGAIRSSNWTASKRHHEQSLARLNRLLMDRASGERYVTMFSCYHDHKAQTLHYINAGHCPPLLVHQTEPGSFEVIKLKEGGTVIGLLPVAEYQQGEVAISPGDVLVVFSDGIVESTNAADEEYGEERLAQEAQAHYSAPVEVLRQRVIESVRQFAAGVPAADDLTFVIVRFSAQVQVHNEVAALTAAV